MMEESLVTHLNELPVSYIMVIGFHHQKGYQVEYSHPPLPYGDKDLPEAWATLSCAALPDGAHNFEEDISIFHVPQLKDNQEVGTEVLFGVSCCRQIESKELRVKDQEITRQTVLKSVCVLMKMPLYGFVLSKLSLVTQAYFNERDFSKTDILKDFFKSLNHSIETARFHDTIFNIGLPLQDLVRRLKQKLLMILKLLLLQRKVLIWGTPVKDVCISGISFISLLPGVLQKGLARSLQAQKSSFNQTSQPPKDQYGLPLDIFGNGHIFQPYLALQQMNDILSSGVCGYLVGASNVLLKDRLHIGWEAMVNMESGSLHIDSKELEMLISLTKEDLRFCDYVVSTVTEKQEEGNDTVWEGSDEWIRAQFKMYLLCMLAANENRLPGGGDESHAFNSDFITAWRATHNYKAWLQSEHPGLDAIIRQHPFAGETTVNDVRLRLQSMLESIANNSGSGKRIGEAVVKTGQYVEGAWSTAKVTLSNWKGWISGIVQDIDTEVHENADRMKNADGQSGRSSSSDVEEDELNHGMSMSSTDRLGLN